MENKVKGTNDCGNNNWNRRYCCNSYQHHRYMYQYPAIQS